MIRSLTSFRALIFSLTTSLCLTNIIQAAETKPRIETKTPTKPAKAASAYRHIVLFEFKEDATPEKIQEVITAFKALPGKISEIKGFEWGTQCSPENLTAGMSHCFMLTFKDKAGFDVYLPHPEHKKFVSIVLPLLKGKPIVADYIAKDIYPDK